MGFSVVDGCNANAASWNAPCSSLEMNPKARLESNSYHHASPGHPPKTTASYFRGSDE